MKNDYEIKIVPPPIHEHYDEERQMKSLCGRVFCPYGFVGIEVVKIPTYPNA